MEKLSQPKYGLDFLVASLGKVENKEEFIKSQTGELPDISSWKVSAFREAELRKEIKRIEKGLKTYFESQARVAELIEQEAELRYQMELKDEVQQHNVKLPSGSLSSLYKLLLRYDEEIQKYGKLRLITRIKAFFSGLKITDRSIIESSIQRKEYEQVISSKRAAKGFGLGLAYTKLLVETHPEGQIGAYPNIDKGSTFWFEIPESLQCQQDTLSADTENTLNSSDLFEASEVNSDIDFEISGHTVLIVEDETDLQEFLRKELSSHFKDIYTASDGVEALTIAKSKKPDIIISDVMMPNKNGYELCSDIKKDIHISHIPIILLTALNHTENRKAGYKSGADIYLTKPFETSVLIAASRNVLKNRAIIKERYKNTSDNVSAVESTFSDTDEKFLIKLDRFIEENLSNDRLNAQMCIEHTYMGRATFYKKIKELTGLGIMEYVTRKRMSTAAGLLIKTQLHISEIAQKTGYPDNQYFSKVFRQHFGMTPRDYRNRTV